MDRKLCCLAAVVVVGVASIAAQELSERKHLIREDRIWEGLTSYSASRMVSHFFKFNGSEERDGKEYSRLVAFRVVTYDSCPDLKLISEQDDIEEVHALIREEDGIVYSYVDDSCVYTGCWEGNLMNKEYILYDFTHDKDDIYEAMGFIGHESFGPIYYMILDSDNVEIDGVECRRLKVSCELTLEQLLLDGGFGKHEIVESIGFTDIGCLFYNEYFNYETGYSHNFHFLRVYDLEGNILYGNKEWITPGTQWSSAADIGSDNLKIIYDENGIYVNSHDNIIIELWNLQGQLVAYTENKSCMLLTTNNIETGTYIVAVKSNGNVMAYKKIIVK